MFFRNRMHAASLVVWFGLAVAPGVPAASAQAKDVGNTDVRPAEPRSDSLTKGTEFYHDFRGKPTPPELVLFNAETGKYLKEEPQGLRITLPNTWTHRWGGVGLKTTFAIRGDFEATSTIEILHNDTPPSGFGVGATLAVHAGKHLAGASRLVRGDGEQIILADHNEPRGEDRTPCKENLVRLRLARSGPTLRISWAPGTSGKEFHEVHRFEFGQEDIDFVRLVGLTGQKPCNLDMRLIDLRIRSEKEVSPAVLSPSAPISPLSYLANKWRLGLALFILISISLSVLFAILRWRGTRETRT